MAHRDDDGTRPGRERQRLRHGGADRARARLRRAAGARPARLQPDAHAPLPLDRRRRVRRPRRRALRGAPGLAATSPAVINLDARRRPRARRGSSSPATSRARRRRPRRRRRGQRMLEQTGRPPARPSALAPARRPRLPVQPLRAGAVRRARASRRVTLTTARRPAARPFGDTPRRARRAPARPARPRGAGRCSARSTRGSSSRTGRELRLPRPARRPRLGDRARADRGAAAVPASRRSTCSRAAGGGRSRSRPALRELPQPARLLALGRRACFELFALLGAWPRRRRAARSRRTAARGDRLAGSRPPRRCSLLGGSAGSSRASACPAPARSRRGGARRPHGRAARARRLALLVVATNPFALLFLLPLAPRLALAPAVRARPGWTRLAVLAAGLRRAAAPARLVRVPLRARPRRALVPRRAARGRLRPVRRPLADRRRLARAAGQLAALAIGRYAPYPARRERPPRGPLREVVRTDRPCVQTAPTEARVGTSAEALEG